MHGFGAFSMCICPLLCLRLCQLFRVTAGGGAGGRTCRRPSLPAMQSVLASKKAGGQASKDT